MTFLTAIALTTTLPVLAPVEPTMPAPVSATRSSTQEEAAWPDVVPTQKEVDAAVQAGLAFLLSNQESYVPDPPVGGMPDEELPGWQEKELMRLSELRGVEDGAEWPYEGVYRVRPDGRIPSGYRVGGTSIVCDVLLRSGAKGDQKKAVEAAVLRSLDFVLGMVDDDKSFGIGPKKGYDVRGWGHAYGLQFLLTAIDAGVISNKGTLARVEAAIPELIARLEANQTSMGGWNYARDNSVSPFMTGSTLLILFEASSRGHEVDKDMVEKALDALEACRTETGSYEYSGRAKRAVDMPGSCARAACADLALFKAGRVDEDALRVAVQGFFEGWDDLLVRKSQQGTHKAPYGIAPYYFFFGHTYAALAIEELPKKERAMRRDEFRKVLWRTREKDGTWNDRIFPRTASYSTAMSVMGLMAPDRGAFPEWKGSGRLKKKRSK